MTLRLGAQELRIGPHVRVHGASGACAGRTYERPRGSHALLTSSDGRLCATAAAQTQRAEPRVIRHRLVSDLRYAAPPPAHSLVLLSVAFALIHRLRTTQPRVKRYARSAWRGINVALLPLTAVRLACR